MKQTNLFSITTNPLDFKFSSISIFDDGILEHIEYDGESKKVTYHSLEKITIRKLKNVIKKCICTIEDLPSLINTPIGCGFSQVKILTSTYTTRADEENFGTSYGCISNCIIAIFSILEKYEWVSFNLGYLCVLDKEKNISTQIDEIGENLQNTPMEYTYALHGALIKFLIQSNEEVYFSPPIEIEGKSSYLHKFSLSKGVLNDNKEKYQLAPFKDFVCDIIKNGEAKIGYLPIEDYYSTDAIRDIFLKPVDIRNLLHK